MHLTVPTSLILAALLSASAIAARPYGHGTESDLHIRALTDLDEQINHHELEYEEHVNQARKHWRLGQKALSKFDDSKSALDYNNIASMHISKAKEHKEERERLKAKKEEERREAAKQR